MMWTLIGSGVYLVLLGSMMKTENLRSFIGFKFAAIVLGLSNLWFSAVQYLSNS